MYEKIYPPNTIFEDGVGRHYEDEYEGSGDEERGQGESRGAEYSQWEDEEDEDCDTNFFITASIQNVVSDKITHDDEVADDDEETINTSVNSKYKTAASLVEAASAASLCSAVYEEEDFEDYSQSRGNTAANPPARRTEEEPLIAATAATIDCVGDSLISVGKGADNFKHITSETQDEDNSQSSGTYEGNKALKALEKLNMSPVVNTREEPIVLSSAVSAASLQSAVYEDEDFEEYSQSFDEMSASTVVTTAVILGAAPAPPSEPKPSASSPRKAEAVSRNAEAVKSGARYSKKQGVG